MTGVACRKAISAPTCAASSARSRRGGGTAAHAKLDGQHQQRGDEGRRAARRPGRGRSSRRGSILPERQRPQADRRDRRRDRGATRPRPGRRARRPRAAPEASAPPRRQRLASRRGAPGRVAPHPDAAAPVAVGLATLAATCAARRAAGWRDPEPGSRADRQRVARPGASGLDQLGDDVAELALVGHHARRDHQVQQVELGQAAGPCGRSQSTMPVDPAAGVGEQVVRAQVAVDPAGATRSPSSSERSSRSAVEERVRGAHDAECRRGARRTRRSARRPTRAAARSSTTTSAGSRSCSGRIARRGGHAGAQRWHAARGPAAARPSGPGGGVSATKRAARRSRRGRARAGSSARQPSSPARLADVLGRGASARQRRAPRRAGRTLEHGHGRSPRPEQADRDVVERRQMALDHASARAPGSRRSSARAGAGRSAWPADARRSRHRCGHARAPASRLPRLRQRSGQR